MFDNGSEMPHVQPDGPLEGKSGGWSANGKMKTGDQLKTVSMQAVFPKSESYTVEFNLQPIAPGATDIAIRCEALITWSVEGNSVSRRVSVGNGVSVTGTGQGVKVVIEDHTDKTFPLLVGKEYIVSMQVAPGVRANSGSPPLLSRKEFVASVAGPGVTAQIDIPQDCGVNSILVVLEDIDPGGGAPIPEQSVFVDELASSSSALFIYDPVVMNEWMPIVPGTTRIMFKNQNAHEILFRFVLGIDG